MAACNCTGQCFKTGRCGGGGDWYRKTIPASDVGVSLQVSNAALIEIDKMRIEAVRAAQDTRHQLQLWR